jgi:cation diffusion facilitator CzcD-associated flavoprotein CzcO
MQDGPQVCVIGAGLSGLTSGKALRDWGVSYTCFEASDDVGGTWYFRNPKGRSSAYRSLHIDTSKRALSFSDFSMDDRYPDFPHHTEIHRYLNEYAEHFGLREQIRFQTPVERAEPRPGGGWQIRTGDEETHEFDALLVCNGHHWDPSYPSFAGSFERVILSTRSGAWVLPKYALGRPVDQVFRTVPWLSLKPQRWLAGRVIRLITGRMEDFGLPTPNHAFGEAHVTVSSELLLRLGSGDAVAKPDVSELLGDRVRFADGSVEAVDAIIYATGYKVTFPFFDPDLISAPHNVLPLYKRMFKPGFDDLAFIGFGQVIPTIFPFAECQAKLAARWLAGDWALPPVPEMEAEIRRDERRQTRQFVPRESHTMEVDYNTYEYDLRKRVLRAGQTRARAGAGAGARSGVGSGAGSSVGFGAGSGAG